MTEYGLRAYSAASLKLCLGFYCDGNRGFTITSQLLCFPSRWEQPCFYGYYRGKKFSSHLCKDSLTVNACIDSKIVG